MRTMDQTSDSVFEEGTPVFDANGDKVGSVSDHNASTSYLVVQKGWLFFKDAYVPRDAIATTDEDGIHLNLTKEELKNRDWETPPDELTAESDLDFQRTDQTTVGTTAGMNTQDRPLAASGTGTTVDTDTNDLRVPVYEEELVVGRRQEEQGRVHVHKDVIEEQETLNVPVERETVHVERVAYSGDADAPDMSEAFTERDIDVPLTGEDVVLSKRVDVVEEVRLHKETVTDNRQVTDTVRKERVVVDGVDEESDTRTGERLQR